VLKKTRISLKLARDAIEQLEEQDAVRKEEMKNKNKKK
jgi:hypothetical protein